MIATAPTATMFVLLSYVLSVAYVDLRTHRIPNLLSGIAAIFGLMLQITSGQTQSALSGLVVGFAIFMPFYILRAFGAGDVKAMATVGIFLGPQVGALASAFTLIAGGIIGVWILFRSGASASSVFYRLLGVALAPMALMRRAELQANTTQMNATRIDPVTPPVQKFPYGIAIAAGTIATLLWTGRLQSILSGQ